MKRLILLIFIGSLFGDTIIYKKFDHIITDKKIKYLGVGEKGITFSNASLFGKTYKTIKCNDVISILDASGQLIKFSCSKLTYFPNNPFEAGIDRELLRSTKKSQYFGGILIAIGGGMLAYENNLDYEDKMNDLNYYKDMNTAGFVLMAFGGLLVAMGI